MSAMPTMPTPPGGSRPSAPLTSSELVNTMSHFHRAEIARMAGWRDRLDRTSNWALTVAAAMLSVSLSSPTSHHGVILFAMLLILLLLWIEARRYRFFDVYRARVRQFERHYFAQIFSPRDDFASDWLLLLGETLRSPKFLIPQHVAFARRLRRNYIYLFSILLLAWVLKISTPNLQEEGRKGDFVHSVFEAIRNATLGPVPGAVVVGIVTIFFAIMIYLTLFTPDEHGELAHGDVHV
jgi:uncharacterized membrane protein